MSSQMSSLPRQQSSWGRHGAHLGPVGPRGAPWCPHEPCFHGSYTRSNQFATVAADVPAPNGRKESHYNDVIMCAIASQNTSLTIVYSIVYSDADQRKHQSSASLALCGEFTGDRWIPRTNGQLRGKSYHLMTSSWEVAALTRQNWISSLAVKYFFILIRNRASLSGNVPRNSRITRVTGWGLIIQWTSLTIVGTPSGLSWTSGKL